MKNIVKIVVSVVVLVSMSAHSLNADVKKGQKLYLKKLKSACGLNGAEMAGKHTGSEWTEIYEDGKLPAELKMFCPKVQDGALKEKYMNHYYDFLHEYSSDSGNVPSC